MTAKPPRRRWSSGHLVCRRALSLRKYGPVTVGRGDVTALVERPKSVRDAVVVQIKLAFHNCPARGINVRDAVDRHSVSAVAAVLRDVLLGVGLETFEVFGGGEAVGGAVPVIRVL